MLDGGCMKATHNFTKESIQEAFWQLYCKKDIKKITVKEITDRAGYNRGTFYVYYKDVYDVLEQIEDSLLPDFHNEEKMKTLVEEGDLEAIIEFIVNEFNSQSKYLSVLLSEKGDPKFPNRYKEQIKPLLKSRMELNDEVDPLKIDFALEFFMSALFGALTHWYKLGQPISTKEFLILLHDLFFFNFIG